MRAVNLIPTDERRGAALGAGRSDGAAYGVMAVLGGLAILALIYGISHHQISSRRSQLATTVARTQRAQATVARLTPYTSFIALREQRVQAVSQLVNSRFDWAHAFRELGRVLPHDASISSLDGQIGSTVTTGSSSGSTSTPSTSAGSSAGAAGAVTSATPPGSIPTFTLAGCATSQAEVAHTLERLRLIDGVGEVSLQSSTKSGPAGSAASGSSAASAGGTGCPSGTATFNVEVSFDPLPAAPAASSSSTKLTSTTGAQG